MEQPKTPMPAADSAAQPQETLLTLASLGLIAEHLGQPVFAKDRSHRFVLVNDAFCKLMQQPRETLLGHTETEVSGQQPCASETKVLEGHAPVSGERRFETFVGSVVTRPTTHLPLTDSHGVVTHVVCVLGHAGDSLASQDKLQEELDRYAVERTRALRAVQQELLRRERLMVLGQLSAGLAHHIRNPLTEITLALALARKHVPKDPDHPLSQPLKIAGDAVFEANRIITDLVDYTRIRAPRPMYMPLLDIVTAALDEERPPDGVTVSLDIPEIEVYVDPQQVRDALRKVIRNAHEAMDGQGELRLHVTLADPTRPADTSFTGTSGQVETTPAAAYVDLQISDTGVGVSEQHRDLLFEPMVTSKALGLGLGLTVALTLVTNQGGSLECVKDVSRGACFSMRLPLQPITADSESGS